MSSCVHCSGAGAHLFRSWAKFLNRSIILTPEVRVNALELLYSYSCYCRRKMIDLNNEFYKSHDPLFNGYVLAVLTHIK